MKPFRFPAVLAALIASVATAPPVHAGDADATAVAVASGRVYVGGSATFNGDLRSSVVGRWNPSSGGFDWLNASRARWALRMGSRTSSPPATTCTASGTATAGLSSRSSTPRPARCSVPAARRA